MSSVGNISASGDISISNTTAVQKQFKVINSLSELWMGVNGNGETFLWTPSNNRLILGTNNAHVVDILANGNVGIGTTSPSYKLHVNGTLGVSDSIILANNKAVSIKDSGGTARNVLLYSSNNAVQVGYDSAGAGHNTYINGNAVYLRYGTSNTVGLALIASGNVGIGTTSPSYKLHVVGTLYASDLTTIGDSSSGANLNVFGKISSLGTTGNPYKVEITNAHIQLTGIASGTTKTAKLEVDSSGRLKVTNECLYCSGSVTALTASSSSDARMKDVIRNTSLTVEQIAGMPSVIFKWKNGIGDRKLHAGSIAQEWQRLLPEVVDTGSDGMLSMSYGVAALVAAISTARRVAEHEKKITYLKERIRELEMEVEQLKTA